MPNNNYYRPVSLTSTVVCKMIEHIIVLHYLNNKYLGNILCTNQHGFRRGLTCKIQLIIAVIHQIFEFVDDDGTTAQIVTFDFSKAFAKVSHRALIDKLHKFNISEQIIIWIENFLKDRKQQVTINNIQQLYTPNHLHITEVSYQKQYENWNPKHN